MVSATQCNASGAEQGNSKMTLESVRTFMDYAVIALAVLNLALAWANLRAIVALKLAQHRHIEAAQAFQVATQTFNEVAEDIKLKRLRPEVTIDGKVIWRD